MPDQLRFYIDGRWVEPAEPRSLAVINPATEESIGDISLGSASDVDRAVAAAVAAFPAFSTTTPKERSELLKRILDALHERSDDIARAIMNEMGAPWELAKNEQAASGPQHVAAALEALKTFSFEEQRGTTRVIKEPIGPVALITPWNWPINQVAVKVAPAIAAGCTMVLKPSELAPLDAMIFAEVLHDAGVPAGVFNLINGDGPTVGAALAAHPDIAMVSFTGSTRAGVAVAEAAAPTVKRVAQELGGKSANIILRDADFDRAVRSGVLDCFCNSGQSCDAPTRLLVPVEKMRDAAEIAADVARQTNVGDPQTPGTDLGPVVSARQWQKIQRYIQNGVDAGAELVAGGPGLPPGLTHGYYVRPTVFANVVPTMEIANEEIFGPVLVIMGYHTEDEAVDIANDTAYGLSGYVSSGDPDRARAIARRLRCGMVHINGASLDALAPFGGYKQSGNGREWGPDGIEEFLEKKSVYGY